MGFLTIILVGFLLFLFYEKIKEEFGPVGPRTADRTLPTFGLALAGLMAIVMKADGQVTKSELAEVKSFLLKRFDEKKTKKMLQLLKYSLEKEITDFRPHCLQLNRNLSYKERLDFLALLFRIAQANLGACENEVAILRTIARHTAIAQSDFMELLIHYAPEYYYAQTRSRFSNEYRGSKLSQAYKTLSLNENATVDEIKKTYRKLAMKYHPDKISNENSAEKLQAAQKFHAITEAYKLLKREKGFS